MMLIKKHTNNYTKSNVIFVDYTNVLTCCMSQMSKITFLNIKAIVMTLMSISNHFFLQKKWIDSFLNNTKIHDQMPLYTLNHGSWNISRSMKSS